MTIMEKAEPRQPCQGVKSNRIDKRKIKRALTKLSPFKKSEELEPRTPLARWDPIRE